MSSTPVSAWKDQDIVAALVFGGAGAGFVVASLRLDFGSPIDMGPAFFPRIVGALLLLLALVIGGRGLAARRRMAAAPAMNLAWRPLLAVLLALVLFVVALRPLGLFAASALLVVVASAAAQDRRWREIAVLAVVLSLAVGLLFVWGLKLQAPLLPWQ